MGPWPGHSAEVPGGPAGLAGPSGRLEAWLPPVRLWLRPKPFLSTIPTPQGAPQSTELPSGPPGEVGARLPLWPRHLQLM